MSLTEQKQSTLAYISQLTNEVTVPWLGESCDISIQPRVKEDAISQQFIMFRTRNSYFRPALKNKAWAPEHD